MTLARVECTTWICKVTSKYSCHIILVTPLWWSKRRKFPNREILKVPVSQNCIQVQYLGKLAVYFPSLDSSFYLPKILAAHSLGLWHIRKGTLCVIWTHNRNHLCVKGKCWWREWPSIPASPNTCRWEPGRTGSGGDRAKSYLACPLAYWYWSWARTSTCPAKAHHRGR